MFWAVSTTERSRAVSAAASYGGAITAARSGAVSAAAYPMAAITAECLRTHALRPRAQQQALRLREQQHALGPREHKRALGARVQKHAFERTLCARELSSTSCLTTLDTSTLSENRSNSRAQSVFSRRDRMSCTEGPIPHGESLPRA